MEHASPKPELSRWLRLSLVALLIAAILSVFVVRTCLAYSGQPPRLFAIFNALIVLVSLGVLAWGARVLRRSDWIMAFVIGACMGIGVSYTSFYPLLELANPVLTSLSHGAALAVLVLAGLAIMRTGGPVVFRIANSEWKKGLQSLGLGLIMGLPFALLNVYAFSLMQNRPIQWHNPLGAAWQALQPGLVEEVAYRFALLGFLWLIVRRVWPERAVLIASVLSLLVHNYAHFDNLFRDNLPFALAYGAVVGLIWGMPMTVLAVRRDLESSVAFHWLQDFVRFAAGF
jgi:Type II CAAX prenyl endopeptidase Rce1-like